MRASGFGMLCLACVAGVTFFFSDLLGIEDTVLIVTSATMLLLGIWVLLDVFRIPGFVRAYNDRLIRWLTADVLQHVGGQGGSRQFSSAATYPGARIKGAGSDSGCTQKPCRGNLDI